MVIFKKTVVTMLIVCLLSLAICVLLEFNDSLLKLDLEHISFYINLAMGIFASGLLVLIPSIVGFLAEKKRYYVLALKTSNEAMDSASEIISMMDTYRKEELKGYVQLYSTRTNELILLYTSFTPFFRTNQKDKLIESMLVQIMKAGKCFLEVEQSAQELSEEQHKQFLKGTKKELQETVIPDFIKYKQMFNQYITGLLGDRNLNKSI